VGILENIVSCSKNFAQFDYLPNLIAFIPILDLLEIISIAILTWGAYLVLKSKNRSWAWLLFIIPHFNWSSYPELI